MEIKMISVGDISGIRSVARLAEKIWFEHYMDIISPQQIQYMVNKFQSEEAITSQINNDGYYYYLFEYEGKYIGYMAFKFMETSVFLSKLYIEKSYRGKGAASQAIKFLCNICSSHKQKSIWLTVNKNNRDSISKYLSLGFSTIRSQKSDIGNGFFMDDFVMQKEL